MKLFLLRKIKVTSATDFKLVGNVYFMVCDEAQCLPPEEVEFSFDIKGVDGGDSVSDTKGSSEKKKEKVCGLYSLLLFLVVLQRF